MTQRKVTRDDLEDVSQLAIAIERAIDRILEDNDRDISISALVSAIVNCTTRRCDTVSEAIFYRDCIQKTFNNAIRNAKLIDERNG